MKCVEGLKKYYSELEKDFHRLLLEVLEKYRATTVDELRNNLEKQSAFFRLLAALDPGFSPTLATDAFGKIYPRAGKVVDREKAFALVTTLESEQASRLKKQVKKAREKFRKSTSRHSLLPVKRLASLIRSRLKFLPEEHLRDRFQDYFRDLFSSLKNALETESLAPEDLEVISQRARELHVNLLLIRRLCATPQNLKDEWMTHLKKLQELLTACREVTQTIGLSTAARKEWPAPLLQRLQEEKTARSSLVVRFFQQIDGELTALESRLMDLLAREPLESDKLKKKADPAEQKNIHSSFGQINVDEGIK